VQNRILSRLPDTCFHSFNLVSSFSVRRRHHARYSARAPIIIVGSPIPKPTPMAILSDPDKPEGEADDVGWAEDVVDAEGIE
jgi:hypothetical protein